MADENGIGSILVELDTLLDTRIGTIAKRSQEAAIVVLENGYHARRRDEFFGINEVWFKEQYAKRDEATLKLSHPTAWLYDLAGLASSLREQAIMRPFYRGYEIVVNIYPYVLSEAVQIALCDTVAYWIKGALPVRCTRIPCEELTPALVKTQYAALSMYDPHAWMNTHANAFASTTCPDVRLFGPDLYQQPLPSAATLKAKGIQLSDPLIALKTLASFLIDLTLIPVAHFSLIDQKRSKRKAA